MSIRLGILLYLRASCPPSSSQNHSSKTVPAVGVYFVILIFWKAFSEKNGFRNIKLRNFERSLVAAAAAVSRSSTTRGRARMEANYNHGPRLLSRWRWRALALPVGWTRRWSGARWPWWWSWRRWRRAGGDDATQWKGLFIIIKFSLLFVVVRLVVFATVACVILLTYVVVVVVRLVVAGPRLWRCVPFFHGSQPEVSVDVVDENAPRAPVVVPTVAAATRVPFAVAARTRRSRVLILPPFWARWQSPLSRSTVVTYWMLELYDPTAAVCYPSSRDMSWPLIFFPVRLVNLWSITSECEALQHERLLPDNWLISFYPAVSALKYFLCYDLTSRVCRIACGVNVF